MQKIILKDNWLVCDIEQVVDYASPPKCAKAVSLPYDVLPAKSRDFSTVLGYENSYYASTVSCFFVKLPKFNSSRKILLFLEQVANSCLVYVDGQYKGMVGTGFTNEVVNITKCYKENAWLCLRVASHPDCGSYVGNGIIGDVSVASVEDEDGLIANHVAVETKKDGNKTVVTAHLDIDNYDKPVKTRQLELEIVKPNGKRLAKKVRMVKIKADACKSYEVGIKLSSMESWSLENPYCYIANVFINGNLQQSIKFGVVKHEIDKGVYKLNGTPVKLVGVHIEPSNALLGSAARYDFEYRKFSAIKNLGFNAVRLSGKMQEETLQVLNDLGLLCIVDICRNKTTAPVSDATNAWLHVGAEDRLTNHPSFAAYSLINHHDNIRRHFSDESVEDMAEWVKTFDSTRSILLPSDTDIIDCFKPLGMDFLGTKIKPQDHTKMPIYTTGGYIDVLGRVKVTACKNQTAIGKNPVCAILVQDPDSIDPIDENDNDTDTDALWNWPHNKGKPIKVVVHSTGDVVALWLNGKQIGRKLAGKYADNKAVFVTNFVAGKLEAISYFKGEEQCRSILETVDVPKAIKLSCDKNTIEIGEYAYIDVSIIDKAGRFIPFASKEIKVEVSQEGEFVAAQNADPKGGIIATSPESFYTFDGHALVAVKAAVSGKLMVKALGDGLNAGKISIKIK